MWNEQRNNTSFVKTVADNIKTNISPADQKQLRYHQSVVVKYITEYKVRGMLIFHKMGMGKSILAAAVCDALNRDVIFISAKSLHLNFQHTLSNYEKQKKKYEPDAPAFKGEIKFISLNASNMFDQVDRASRTELEDFLDSNVKMRSSLDNKTVIIDEAHNLFNAITNGSKNAVKLYNAITKSKCTVLFLTGSPVVNDPFELVPCFNMLSGTMLFPEDYFEFTNYYTLHETRETEEKTATVRNLDKFANRINGMVSYYAGEKNMALGTDMPKELPLQEVTVNMSTYQYTLYLQARKKEIEQSLSSGQKKTGTLLKPKVGGSFRVMSRQLSNFAYPEYAQEKTRSLQNDFEIFQSNIEKLDPEEVGKNIAIYSPKIVALYANIRQEGIGLVYSQFIKYGSGIIKMYLEFKGWKEYESSREEKSQENAPVFAVLTGETDSKDMDKILEVLNSLENKMGDIIKIILVSSTAAEGVDFKNLRHIHIFEPYWNISRIKQVIGRGVRYRSHNDLEVSKREVKPYIYLSHHGIKDNLEKTTDIYLLEKAKKNAVLIDEFYSVIRRHAIDCSLHYDDCEVCPSTNKKLFEEDFNADKDLKNPCINNQVRAEIFEYEGEKYARYEQNGEVHYAKLINETYVKVSDELRDILASLGF